MKIGILDYQLTHSHYKKFHTLLAGPVGAGEVTFSGAFELSPSDEGKKWCTDKQVPHFATVDEVLAASEAIMVLAPNNPEKHLEVAGSALASGKPVYIDKLLAHTPDMANAMMAVAKKAGTPLMCASALRFAPELDELDKQIKGKPEGVFARGYGKFPIYGIHTITLALRYFGAEIGRVIDTGDEAMRLLTIDTGGRKASVEVRDSKNGKSATPWQAGVLSEGAYRTTTITNADAFYENLMRKTLEFFRTGKSPVSVEEQLAAVQIQHAADRSHQAGGTWVDAKA